MNIGNWKKHGFEFLSIFIAVISAFALNNWNDNRGDNTSEQDAISTRQNPNYRFRMVFKAHRKVREDYYELGSAARAIECC